MKKFKVDKSVELSTLKNNQIIFPLVNTEIKANGIIVKFNVNSSWTFIGFTDSGGLLIGNKYLEMAITAELFSYIFYIVNDTFKKDN